MQALQNSKLAFRLSVLALSLDVVGLYAGFHPPYFDVYPTPLGWIIVGSAVALCAMALLVSALARSARGLVLSILSGFGSLPALFLAMLWHGCIYHNRCL